jgi:hypothetical protein
MPWKTVDQKGQASMVMDAKMGCEDGVDAGTPMRRPMA